MSEVHDASRLLRDDGTRLVLRNNYACTGNTARTKRGTALPSTVMQSTWHNAYAFPQLSVSRLRCIRPGSVLSMLLVITFEHFEHYPVWHNLIRSNAIRMVRILRENSRLVEA